MTPQKILVFRAGGIGDTILVSPLLQNIRRLWPEARITLAGIPDRIDLLHGFPNADLILSSESPIWTALYGEEGIRINETREFLNSFDLAFIFSSLQSEPFIRNLRDLFAERVTIRDSMPPDSWKRHYSEYLNHTLENMGEKPVFCFPVISINGKVLSHSSGRLAPRAVIHPGSGGIRKCLPLPFYVEIAERVEQDLGLGVDFVLGPAEIERGWCGFLEEKGISWKTFERLIDLSEWISHRELLIGNDSGISHLAGALGLSTVVLFTITDTQIWGPLGSRVHILDFREGGEEISVKRVMGLVGEAVKANQLELAEGEDLSS